VWCFGSCSDTGALVLQAEQRAPWLTDAFHQATKQKYRSIEEIGKQEQQEGSGDSASPPSS